MQIVNGEYQFITKGDNNIIPDTAPALYRDVIGKTVVKLPAIDTETVATTLIAASDTLSNYKLVWGAIDNASKYSPETSTVFVSVANGAAEARHLMEQYKFDLFRKR